MSLYHNALAPRSISNFFCWATAPERLDMQDKVINHVRLCERHIWRSVEDLCRKRAEGES